MPYKDIEIRKSRHRATSAARYARIRQDPVAYADLLEHERDRARRIRREQTKPCRLCAAPIPRGDHTQRCETCKQGSCKVCARPFRVRVKRGKTTQYCSITCYHRRGRHYDPRVGTSCMVWVRNCDQCGRLFTARQKHSLRCSDECRRTHAIDYQRDTSREYQRRTRYTAIRYWAVDKSPDAIALAATYYELRQQLRRIRHA